MNDLSFVTNGTLDRRQHMADIRREGFKQKLKHIADDTEQAVDYCRDLLRSGASVKDELRELRETGHALALVAGLLELQIKRSAE